MASKAYQFGMWPQVTTPPIEGEGGNNSPGVPALGLRGWASFDGSDGSILYNSGLVTSTPTRTGTGVYQVPIGTELYNAFANNLAVGVVSSLAVGGQPALAVGATPDLTVRTVDAAGDAADADFALVVLWRGTNP